MSGTEVSVREEVGAVGPADAGDISALVRLAIEEKVPVEQLERIVALKERVDERNARAAFVEALTAFRENCPPIPKTKENTQFSVTYNGVKRPSKYAPLEVIDRVARPVAAEHGLVWTWDTEISGEMMHVTCRVLHVFGHSESSTVSMPHESRAGSSPQQKYGAAQTYGMRYSLIAALGLTMADEDNDGNAPDTQPEPITEEQLANLEALISEVGEAKANVPGMLRYFGVEKLSDLPRARNQEAVDVLERKRGKAS